jgi:putative heme-binding domain-containing protein
MPVLSHLGPAAPSGLLRYEAGNFGPEYEGDLFACLFNLHKVTRHELAAEGSGLRAADSDFVVAESLDFHPTDVIEDADGSLLVLDTGGWYKLCCPTSQLHKPEVLGAIYRVRKKGEARVDDPRGLKLEWGKASAGEQAARLGDARWAVRERAVEALGALGSVDEPGSVARTHPDSKARVGAVWALTRIPGDAAREGVREALRDRDATVRQAALNSISLWKDAAAAGELARILSSGGMSEKRLAAEAIGRIGKSQAVEALLDAATGEMDREAEHAVTFALILIGDRGETAKGLGSKSARARRIALVAIDQMQGAALQFDEVSPALSSRDEQEAETALWVASRHPEWAREMAPLVRAWLMEATTASKQKASRFRGSDEARGVLGEVARAAPAEARRAAFELMGSGEVVAEPAGWGAAVRAGIASEDEEVVRAALGVVGKVVWSAEEAARIEAAIGLLVARGEASIVALGLGAMPRPGFALGADEFQALVASLGSDEAVAIRGQAARALTRAGLTDSQWVDLANAVGGLGPMELATLLPVFEKSADPKVGEALVAGLEGSKALVGLRVDDLKGLLARFGPGVQERSKVLIEGMEQERDGRLARLESLLSKVPSGDIVRGQAVFNGPRAACSSCHAMGYLGGKVGPDLTKVGAIRSDRDLLEAIVYPSASFVRSYEPVLVATTDGRVLNGLLKKDGSEEVVLAIDATQEVRIARSKIEEMKAGEVSVMPAGLDQQLTEEQIADLVAFLKAAR